MHATWTKAQVPITSTTKESSDQNISRTGSPVASEMANGAKNTNAVTPRIYAHQVHHRSTGPRRMLRDT